MCKENENKSEVQKALDALAVQRTEQENDSFAQPFFIGSKKDALDILQALHAVPVQQTEQELSSRQPTELEQEFERNYEASVEKVVGTIDNEIQTNDCFTWTSAVQGATDYDLLCDVIIEWARKGLRQEQASRGTILGKLEEDALSLYGAMNTIDVIKNDLERRIRNMLHTEAGQVKTDELGDILERM